MKIKDKREKCAFGELFGGDCFEISGALTYMKLEPTDGEDLSLNAVTMNFGGLDSFSDDDTVFPLTTHLVIEGRKNEQN